MKILAVIPARGGSKGVPRKNMKLLLGNPLIFYSVNAALGSRLITDTVLTTDDEEIRRAAILLGAEAPFLRPAELATDYALAIPTVQHAVREMEQYKALKFEIVIMLQPTAPLRTANDVDDALDQLIRSGADGIISIVDVDNWHPMKMKKIVGDLLVDYQPPPVENPPRQTLPKVFMVNGAIYATRRDLLMNENTFKGTKCLPYVMPAERSVNIDTEIDFLVAEYYLQRNTKDEQ